MTMIAGFHVDDFASADHIQGRRRTYAAIKKMALSAGRYSIFEATSSTKNAKLFMRLDRDPMVERFDLGYPWIGVRQRETPRVATADMMLCTSRRGAGWYYSDSEYPDDGMCGPYETRELAAERAVAAGYQVRS